MIHVTMPDLAATAAAQGVVVAPSAGRTPDAIVVATPDGAVLAVEPFRPARLTALEAAADSNDLGLPAHALDLPGGPLLRATGAVPVPVTVELDDPALLAATLATWRGPAPAALSQALAAGLDLSGDFGARFMARLAVHVGAPLASTAWAGCWGGLGGDLGDSLAGVSAVQARLDGAAAAKLDPGAFARASASRPDPLPRGTVADLLAAAAECGLYLEALDAGDPGTPAVATLYAWATRGMIIYLGKADSRCRLAAERSYVSGWDPLSLCVGFVTSMACHAARQVPLRLCGLDGRVAKAALAAVGAPPVLPGAFEALAGHGPARFISRPPKGVTTMAETFLIRSAVRLGVIANSASASVWRPGGSREIDALAAAHTSFAQLLAEGVPAAWAQASLGADLFL